MDPSLDDFINYDNNNTDPLRIDFPDFGFNLGSPALNESDLFRNVPSYMPKTIQNMLDQDTNNNENNHFFNFDELIPASTPFVENNNSQPSANLENYTPIDQTEASYSPNTQEENEPMLNTGSKKITKRERAKLKSKAKQEALHQMLDSVDKKYIPAEFYDPEVDEETKRKMIQVIRNRVSAQSSRDKKKVYVSQLEEAQAELKDENNELKRQNELLAKQLRNSMDECRSLAEQIEALRRKDSSMCLKCGPSSDFGPSDTTDDVSAEYSGTSSPLLYREQGRKNAFFGFGAAFTTIMCFLLFMGSNDFSDATNGKVQMFNKNNSFGYFGSTDKSVCKKSDGPAKQNVQTTREISLDSSSNDSPLLERLKPLVDTFNADSKDVYQKYEQKQVVVDLANNKFEQRPNKITSIANNKGRFLRNATKTIHKKNLTSTLLISNGVEVQRNESNNPIDTPVTIQEEIVGGDYMLQNEKPYGVEKADFVQLFIPKNTLGGLNGAQNIMSEGAFPIIEEGTEGSEGSTNSLIEVWAKIYAVRNVGSI